MVKVRPLQYTKVFDGVRLLGDLLAPEGLNWKRELPRGEDNSEFVIHLSCMAHYTPHIPLLAQLIMEKIGLPCPILGGPENCCGAVHYHLGESRLGERVARVGLAGFRRANRKTVLSVCPDCDEIFAKVMPDPAPFRHTNVTELFVQHLDDFRPLMKELDRRVIVHFHDHNEARRRDASNVTRILEAIPGVSILEAHHNIGPGAHCQILGPMAEDDQQAMFREGEERSADTLVVPYHSCYRQHLKMELEYPLRVEHYLTVLGAALGIEVRETYKELRLLDDIDMSLEALRPKFEALGYTEEQVRPVIESGVYLN